MNLNGKKGIKSGRQEKLWYNEIRKILPNQEDIFMAYISSKEFKTLLKEELQAQLDLLLDNE